jgi:dihydrofolate synthase/folylpolyglutamate synthase
MNPSNTTYETLLLQFFQSEKIWEYSLTKIQKACRNFWNPEKQFKSIHIAGTNGKGSVSKMIFQILKESGKTVWIYTSPHLIDIRERFETEKWKISEDDFVRYATTVIEYDWGLSYYERCVLLAFLYFHDVWCEYAVIEVGLWGRLDATNIIYPILSIITSIGYDHMEFLGETLEQIANEKWGIIKPRVPVILYNTNPTLESIAKDQESPVIFPEKRSIKTNMLGNHQLSNARIAYEAGIFLWIDEKIIQDALLHVNHPGRMQYLSPNLLIDGAHNEEWLTKLREYLSLLDINSFSEIVYCFNLKAGKSVELVTQIFPEIETWHILSGNHPLISSADLLSCQLDTLSKNYQVISIDELYMEQRKYPQTLFVVFGSLYLLGEVLKQWDDVWE